MKVGLVAPLSSRFDYFGVPILNGALLALEEAIADGAELSIVPKDDAGRPERTAICIRELDDEGVVAILGPVESHTAAVGAQEARRRRLPVMTPSATASYLTRSSNPWFFRAISSDQDRTDALARWAVQDLGDQPILVVHETSPSSEDAHDIHPPLYGESAGQDFLRALASVDHPFEHLTFDRDNVLSRDLRRRSAQLLRDDAVGAVAILSPSVNVIKVGEYLRSVRGDLPIYMISPGRDLFERSAIRDGVRAVTDTIIEDTDAVELLDFRADYCERFPDEPDDPVYQYATFAYDAGRILSAALRRPAVIEAAEGDLATLRQTVRAELLASPPRTDLLMSTGNFVGNNDLMFKPSRRILKHGSWVGVSRDELRRLGAGPAPPDVVDTDSPAQRRVYDAFISYRHLDPDQVFTRKLLRRLEEAGFSVAFDHRDFHAALTFLEEMERCVRESRYTLAIVSPRYFLSGNTMEEAVISQVLNMDTRRARFIPLIIETAEMPAWMYSLVGIDFSVEDDDVDPYDKLVRTLRGVVPGPDEADERDES